MVREVRWPSATQKQLAKVYEYILPDSYQNAEKIKKDILVSTYTVNRQISGILNQLYTWMDR